MIPKKHNAPDVDVTHELDRLQELAQPIEICEYRINHCRLSREQYIAEKEFLAELMLHWNRALQTLSQRRRLLEVQRAEALEKYRYRAPTTRKARARQVAANTQHKTTSEIPATSM